MKNKTTHLFANRPTELPDPRKHPAIHLTNSIAKLLNIERVVAGQKNSLALRAQGLEQLAHLAHARVVQPVHRLVQQQDVRVFHYRLGYA